MSEDAALSGFDLSTSVHATIPPDHFRMIGLLAVNWASYDSVITYLLLTAFGFPLDTGSMFVATMSTDTKLHKLKQLLDHYGHDSFGPAIKRLKKAHESFVGVRNTVMHQKLVGVLKQDSNVLCYAEIKHVKGEIGSMSFALIPINDLEKATEYAATSTEMIISLAESAFFKDGIAPIDR